MRSSWAACAVLVALTASARAEEPVVELGHAELSDRLHDYFRGEKREGPFFFGAGVLSLAAGGVFTGVGNELLRGMAYPMFGIGLLQVVVGAVVYLRTDAQVRRLDAELAASPGELKLNELYRMRRVNAQFRILKYVEAGLLLAGVVTTAVGAGVDQDTVKGIGIGLAVESGIMLTLDHLAHRRGIAYERALEAFQVAIAPAPGGGAVAAVGGRF